MSQDLKYKIDRNLILNLQSSMVQMTTKDVDQWINFMIIIANVSFNRFNAQRNSRLTELINLEKDFSYNQSFPDLIDLSRIYGLVKVQSYNVRLLS